MKGPTETWLDSQGTNEIYVEESGLLAFAREQDAKLAQAEAERDKYKAESRSLNRERAAEVARADAAEQRAETAETERERVAASLRALMTALVAVAPDWQHSSSYLDCEAALTPAAPDGGTT